MTRMGSTFLGAILSLSVLAGCEDSVSEADCYLQIRYDGDVYTSGDAAVVGLDRVLGQGTQLDCEDTSGSVRRFNSGSVDVWSLRGVDPAKAVAVQFGDTTDSEQATLFIRGDDFCAIDPLALEKIEQVGPGPCPTAEGP